MAPRKSTPKADSPQKVKLEPTNNSYKAMIEDNVPEDNTAIATKKKTTAQRGRKGKDARTSASVKVSKDKVVKAGQKTIRKKKALAVERNLTPALMSFAYEESPMDDAEVGEVEEDEDEGDEADYHVQSYLSLDERKIDREREAQAAVPGNSNKYNGREKGRRLVQWKRPRMAEKLLLNLQFECHRAGIQLPWAKAVHRLSPGASSASALQNLAKMRDILITEGHEVPPLVGKSGQGDPTPWIRGYVRKQGSANVHQAVARVWTDPVVHLKESLQDHGIVRGSGQYRKIKSINAFRESMLKDLEGKGEPIPEDLKTPVEYTTMAEHKARNGGARTIYESRSLANQKRVPRSATEQGSRARQTSAETKNATGGKSQPKHIKDESGSESDSYEGMQSDNNLPTERATRPRRQNMKPVNYVVDVNMEENSQESSEYESVVPTPKAYGKGRSFYGGKGIMVTPPETNITDFSYVQKSSSSLFSESRSSGSPLKQVFTSVANQGATATYDQNGSKTEREQYDIHNSPSSARRNRQKLEKPYDSDSSSTRSTSQSEDRDEDAISENEDAHGEIDDDFTIKSESPVPNVNIVDDLEEAIEPKVANARDSNNMVVNSVDVPTMYYNGHPNTASGSQQVRRGIQEEEVNQIIDDFLADTSSGFGLPEEGFDQNANYEYWDQNFFSANGNAHSHNGYGRAAVSNGYGMGGSQHEFTDAESPDLSFIDQYRDSLTELLEHGQGDLDAAVDSFPYYNGI